MLLIDLPFSHHLYMIRHLLVAGAAAQWAQLDVPQVSVMTTGYIKSFKLNHPCSVIHILHLKTWEIL